jgi:hypothetical protein
MATTYDADRVQRATPERIGQRIHRETRERIEDLGRNPARIDPRLDELRREWDIERALELTAGSLSLTGSVLALTVDRRFAALPLVVTGFLVQHVLQGWCPPLPIFRALGFRTQREIEDEKHTLRMMRGDYPSGDEARRSPTDTLAVVEHG